MGRCLERGVEECDWLGGPRQWDLEMGVQSRKEPGGKGRFQKGLDISVMYWCDQCNSIVGMH